MRRLALVSLAILVGSPVAAQDAADVPVWAEGVQLVMFGGPAPGDLEILLNGEFVIEVTDVPGTMAEIADLMQAGPNVLEVRMRPPEVERVATNRLRIQVAPVTQLSSRQQRMEQPLVEIEIPAELERGVLECAQTATFWAGPVPEKQELKNDYYVIVEGPPIHHWVTMSVNGRPVHGTSGGRMFFEISDFVIKGKNEVVFDFVPTCMVPPSGR
ncbi:MAG: hypothetical protein R3344_05255, partial [Acidobacteriota bacterium]|nr:hypothetical protein [Acidobacteriota bacterium]